jgi:hypothetical protein
MESRLAQSSDSERSVFGDVSEADVSEADVSEADVSEDGDEGGCSVDMIAWRGFEYATGMVQAG